MTLFDDRVQVVIDGKEVFNVEDYQTNISMMVQPAKFAAKLGHRNGINELIFKYPPGTKFELLVAGTRQFDGHLDGIAVQGSGGKTSLAMTGRDTLAPVHDAFVKAEKTWTNISLVELVTFVLDEVLGSGKYTLAADNASNRSAMSNASGKKGKKTTKKAANLTPTSSGTDALLNAGQEFLVASGLVGPGTFKTAASKKVKKIQAKLGMRYYADLLKPQLDRAGLFLWSTQGGTFILAELDPDQAPLYEIRNSTPMRNNVKSFTYQDDTSGRYAGCDVHGRRGGGKEARTTLFGTFDDVRMRDAGFVKRLIIQDDKATTIEQCEFMARRKVAETRRSSHKVTYVVSGHTTKQLDAEQRVIWIPDTVAKVVDDELGFDQNFYVEAVTHAGNPTTTETQIDVVFPNDVVFGDGQGEA